MIGQAIHKILKNKISALSKGGIFPVIVPQVPGNSINKSPDSAYPLIIYHCFDEQEISKEQAPNILFSRVMLQVISDTYKSMDDISQNARDILDHYQDKSLEGLAGVPGYTDNGYTHNFINNVDIQHIFFQDEEDEYYDKLNLFSRRLEFEVYYYNSINKFSYNAINVILYSGVFTFESYITNTNALALSMDFTQANLLKRADPVGGGPTRPDYDYKTIDGTDIVFAFNTLGTSKDIWTNSSDYSGSYGNHDFYQYLQASNTAVTHKATYRNGVSAGTKPYLEFDNYDNLGVLRTDATEPTPDINQFCLPFGAMFIIVYRPTGVTLDNYLLGSNNEAADKASIILSHKKSGSDITITLNPNGSIFNGSARERILLTSTDSTKYWDAKYHFLCVSLGGSKNYTGGTYNQKGWFEYFNSDFNPKLTTGQILEDNLITGNTDTFAAVDNNFTFSRVGNGGPFGQSAGFNMYEFLMFVPDAAKTHKINADAAPFQPTDIIYKKVKEYIYNKYESLK